MIRATMTADSSLLVNLTCSPIPASFPYSIPANCSSSISDILDPPHHLLAPHTRIVREQIWKLSEIWRQFAENKGADSSYTGVGLPAHRCIGRLTPLAPHTLNNVKDFDSPHLAWSGKDNVVSATSYSSSTAENTDTHLRISGWVFDMKAWLSEELPLPLWEQFPNSPLSLES